MLELKEQVPEVPLSWYFKYILPPLPDGIDTKKIVASLKKSKAIKNNSWAGIPEHPRDDSRHEDDVYAGLENVFERIVDAAKTQIPGLEQKSALKLTPHAKATSERDSTTMPDGHFTSIDEAVRLSRSGEEPSLYQVWNSHEFKKGNERVRDIMNQVRIPYPTSPISVLIMDLLVCFSGCLRHATNHGLGPVSAVYVWDVDHESLVQTLVLLSRCILHS